MATTETARRRPGRTSDRLIAAVWGDHAHLHDPATARRRRLALSAVAAVSAVGALISALHAFAIPPFQPPDETAHVAYALSIAGGDVPRIDEFPIVDRIPHMREGLSVWVTNHPPLVYALLAVPLRLGEGLGIPLVGFFAARLALVVATGIGLALVGWFALLLLPRREGAAVVATGAAALIPNALHIGGMVYSDGIGFTLVTALLVSGLVVLQRGVTTRRVVVLTLLAVAAANTRVVGLAAAGGCVACLALAQLLHGQGRVTARAVRGALLSGGVGLVTLASGAWFYVLFNLSRYGTLTGSSALMELHSRTPHDGSVLERLVQPAYWRSLANQYWARIEADAEGLRYVPELLAVTGRWVVGLVLLAAVVVGVWRLARGSWRQPPAMALSWAVAIVWFLVLFVAMADFVQSGGGSHVRYLWPGVATYGAVAATALTAPPGRWAAVPATAFVALHAVVAGLVVAVLTFRAEVPGPVVALRALAADAPIVAGAVLAVAAAVALAGLVWWAVAVTALLDGDDRAHRVAPARGRTIGVGGARRVEIRPADVALATVAGTAGGWLAAYHLEIFVDLPTLAAAVAVAAALASALARRRPAEAGVAGAGAPASPTGP